jgi:hypothetical protein
LLLKLLFVLWCACSPGFTNLGAVPNPYDLNNYLMEETNKKQSINIINNDIINNI